MSVSYCLPHPVAVSAFMICRGLCACTEMLWMCVLYVSFGSKVRPRTFGCVAMGSALLFNFFYRLSSFPRLSDDDDKCPNTGILQCTPLVVVPKLNRYERHHIG